MWSTCILMMHVFRSSSSSKLSDSLRCLSGWKNDFIGSLKSGKVSFTGLYLWCISMKKYLMEHLKSPSNLCKLAIRLVIRCHFRDKWWNVWHRHHQAPFRRKKCPPWAKKLTRRIHRSLCALRRATPARSLVCPRPNDQCYVTESDPDCPPLSSPLWKLSYLRAARGQNVSNERRKSNEQSDCFQRPLNCGERVLKCVG